MFRKKDIYNIYYYFYYFFLLSSIIISHGIKNIGIKKENPLQHFLENPYQDFFI